MPPEIAPEVLDTRTPFRGRIFDAVVERIRIAPDGGPQDVEIVRHPGSVGIIAMPDDRSIMLVRQYRHATGGWLWELPAGSVNPGESAAAAAARECQEELGLVAGSITAVGELFPLPGYCTELMTFFKASALRLPAPHDPAVSQDADEEIEARPFAITELWEMLRSRRLRDLKTAAALALLSGQ